MAVSMNIRGSAPTKEFEPHPQLIAGTRVGSRQRASTYPLSGPLKNTDDCPSSSLGERIPLGDRMTTYSSDYTEACLLGS
jgi:hypothetical protein